MKIENLKQPPLNTTLMGTIRGVADCFGIEASDAMLFGGSGHAFVINIHEQLCPSGPYCWDSGPFERLIGNLGIARTDHGFFASKSAAEARSALESVRRSHLDEGRPCSLLNLENQKITGYDEAGLDTVQPWYPHNKEFPPKRLSFGTWAEFGEEFHVNFFSYEKVDQASRQEVIVASLEYAVDLWENPSQHTGAGYGIGPDAYARFIEAVKADAGNSHGNWWNATVWAECRSMAAAYFGEIVGDIPEISTLAQALSDGYGSIADGLTRASDKEMGAAEKVSPLEAIRDEEAVCVGKVAQCVEAVRADRNRCPEKTGS